MKHRYLVMLVLLVLLCVLAVTAAGCTSTMPPTTVTTSAPPTTSPTTSVSGTTTTSAGTTTATTSAGGHAPGSRPAVAPATLGGCTPADGYQGYHTLPLDSTHYYSSNQFAGYMVTIVWRDYQTDQFTPKISLWVVDTVYDLNVLKQQMGSKGGFWGVTLNDASNYAAARSSQGHNGWEHRDKATGEAWVGVDIGNGIYLYAFSTPKQSITISLETLRAFVDGLNLGCWAALAPA